VATTAGNPIGIRDLLDAGLHFGHQTKRWNPKMKRYIFDKRSGIHLIDLAQSLAMLEAASEFVRQTVASGRSILFVGTKKQAQEVIKNTATECGHFYVTHRWLGGTLTNNTTIRRSVKRMREIEALEKGDGLASMHKKEASSLRHELAKLRRNLSGVADMGDRPGAVFVVDINREAIAVREANKLGIPVIAIVDTNCDPDPVNYVIPGNDDAIRAIKLIAGALGDAVKQGGVEYSRVAAETTRKKQAEEESRRRVDEARASEARKSAEARAKAPRRAAAKPHEAPSSATPPPAAPVAPSAPAEPAAPPAAENPVA
jgi:small subunit ribosomal protein S2